MSQGNYILLQGNIPLLQGNILLLLSNILLLQGNIPLLQGNIPLLQILLLVACVRNRVAEWNRQRWAEISSCDVVQGVLGFEVCCKKGSCSLCSMLFVNPS
uniref:Uncharacterized protein n=1 Tax=Eutreptiella gymnastica TaxID=73025 RepID=A0A6T2F591_9EUGL